MMAMVDQKPIMHQKLRKTKFCSFLQQGRCLRGEDCTYAHSQAELESIPDFSKTTICSQWKHGKCLYSAEKCRFAHGKQDLQGSPQLGYEPAKIQVRKPRGAFHAPALVSCIFRRPIVGDQVQSLVGEVTLEDSHGNEGAWKLRPGEHALVTSVDEDGDFRLFKSGLESCITYRKDYAYIQGSLQGSWVGQSPWLGSWGHGWQSWGGFTPLRQPLHLESLPEECNHTESSPESTEAGISSGNTSDDDCSTLGSDAAEGWESKATSRNTFSPPPGLLSPQGLLPPPGLAPPPGLCHPSMLDL
jgi:hypothetical protein